MKVILTEKPSVARDIAAFLHAHKKHDGYYEGNDHQITWAYGHLVTLHDFEDYDTNLKRWSLDSLPFYPRTFDLKVINNKNSRKQFRIIKNLFRSATQLICATDAGREGELIFRYIQKLSGVEQKPFFRLWLSSLTTEAIRKAFDTLRPGADFDNLYEAARCRSQADWVVGLNATRCYTIRFGKHRQLWSVGRVQTPVLCMIVTRDDEIRGFNARKFWDLSTLYRKVRFKFTGDRFYEQKDADQLLKKVVAKPFKIAAISAKEEVSKPPLLYDLTDLQRDMNRRYGYSAASTLKTAQSLYEKKLITYPRTDSRYLSSDMKSVVPKVLGGLQSVKSEEIGMLDLQHLSFSPRILNDRKVTDHHAIIPTGKFPAAVDPSMMKVFDAILTRLIAAFYPPCVKKITTVNGVSNAVPFQAKGTVIESAGWTSLYPSRPVKPQTETALASSRAGTVEPNEQILPNFVVNETGPHEPFLKECETKPPKHYTENTLLASMETAGRFVEEEALREALKEKGLGTPATRAATIELLIARQYIERNRKTLTATTTGRRLISLLGENILRSPEMTGEWEQKLKKIESGVLAPERFMDEIKQFTNQIIVSSGRVNVDESKFGACPLCGDDVIKGKKGYGCSGWKGGCKFVIWPDYKGYLLSGQQIRELLQLRRLLDRVILDQTRGMEVLLYLSASGQVMEIPAEPAETRTSSKPRNSTTSHKAGDSPVGTCPLCKSQVVPQKKSFRCSNWKQGCAFTIWRKTAGKSITKSHAKTLLAKGRTATLKGFKSKSGNAFTAALKIVDGKVVLDFD